MLGVRADAAPAHSWTSSTAIPAGIPRRERVSAPGRHQWMPVQQSHRKRLGLLVERLQREGGMVYRQNAQAITARELWLNSFALPQALGAEPLEPDRLATELRKGLGGQDLLALGRDDDIMAAAQIDRFDIIPRLDTKTMRISRLEA
jgi:hypothetical protein